MFDAVGKLLSGGGDAEKGDDVINRPLSEKASSSLTPLTPVKRKDKRKTTGDSVGGEGLPYLVLPETDAGIDSTSTYAWSGSGGSSLPMSSLGLSSDCPCGSFLPQRRRIASDWLTASSTAEVILSQQVQPVPGAQSPALHALTEDATAGDVGYPGSWPLSQQMQSRQAPLEQEDEDVSDDEAMTRSPSSWPLTSMASSHVMNPPPGLLHPSEVRPESTSTTPGSVLHERGECKPCAWFWKPQGCFRGKACQHCHLCVDASVKVKKREKLRSISMMSEATMQAQLDEGVDLLDSLWEEESGGPVLAEPETEPPVRVVGVEGSAAPVVRAAEAERDELPASAAHPEWLDQHSKQGPTDVVESPPASTNRALRATEGDVAHPSVGSALHATGECKPCAWFHKAQGCFRGKECGYCHYCPPGELKTQRKKKVAQMREYAAVAAAAAVANGQAERPPSDDSTRLHGEPQLEVHDPYALGQQNMRPVDASPDATSMMEAHRRSRYRNDQEAMQQGHHGVGMASFSQGVQLHEDDRSNAQANSTQLQLLRTHPQPSLRQSIAGRGAAEQHPQFANLQGQSPQLVIQDERQRQQRYFLEQQHMQQQEQLLQQQRNLSAQIQHLQQQQQQLHEQHLHQRQMNSLQKRAAAHELQPHSHGVQPQHPPPSRPPGAFAGAASWSLEPSPEVRHAIQESLRAHGMPTAGVASYPLSKMEAGARRVQAQAAQHHCSLPSSHSRPLATPACPPDAPTTVAQPVPPGRVPPGTFAMSHGNAARAFEGALPPGIPSRGSLLHMSGRCRPCSWYHKPQGCSFGRECCHCHLCPEGEALARRNAKEMATCLGSLPAHSEEAGSVEPHVLSLQPFLSRSSSSNSLREETASVLYKNARGAV
mmetsp:Transcript_16033/g.36757  ORF Transcript_16033/g.36757 Transcript_16033/m.36757 type:complete len:882 (+) Transcript_16033:131-2776(+)